MRQRPLTQSEQFSLPSLAPPTTRRVRRRTRSLSGTHSLLWPLNFPTLANAHARSPPHFHTHAMPPSIVRRMDRGHVLLSDGWVARAPAPISAPLRPSPSQLAAQRPQRKGHAGRQRRRGQRRQHYLLASGRGAPRHRLAPPHLTPPRRPTLLPTTITLCHTASPASATSDSAIAHLATMNKPPPNPH